jgi:hypothetical protein
MFCCSLLLIFSKFGRKDKLIEGNFLRRTSAAATQMSRLDKRTYVTANRMKKPAVPSKFKIFRKLEQLKGPVQTELFFF